MSKFPINKTHKYVSYSQKLIEYFTEIVECDESGESKEDVSFNLEDIKEFINKFAEIEADKKKNMTDCFPFGKYKYKSIKSVLSFDRQYINWLRNQDMLSGFPNVKAEIERLL
jgi:hypothetical protein